MPIFYAVKHVFRSWKLFLALLIGITLASAFFAGIDIKANATAKQALDQQLRYVYVDMQANIQNLSNLTKLLTARDKVLGVSGVLDAEIISRVHWVQITIFGEDGAVKEDMARITAITNYSHVYKGWLNRPTDEIDENETYIPENTALANLVKINDIIQVNFSTYYDARINIALNLTVKGFAQLNDKAAAIASGYQQWFTLPLQTEVLPPKNQMDFLLLVSWERTMQKILKAMEYSYPYMDTSLLIYLNRDNLINPWDIGTSLNNLQATKKVSRTLWLKIWAILVFRTI